jgi:DNA-binding XRE family transcriptional regulator
MSQKTTRRTRHPKKILRLRQLRRAREMSQEALGLRVGLKKATICQIENGDRQPSFDAARALAKEFGESIESVFEYVEVPA